MLSNNEPGQARIINAVEYESFVVTTPSEGEAFEADYGKVWSVLKDLMLKGPAYAYISPLDHMRNYGVAIKAL